MAIQVPPNCDLTLGLRCLDKSTLGRTRWHLHADERFANPAGVVQGGFICAAMDSAMGASAVSSVGERRVFVANTDMRVSFVRSLAVGDDLEIDATVVKSGRSLAFVEARAHDREGRLVATASSTYVLKER